MADNLINRPFFLTISFDLMKLLELRKADDQSIYYNKSACILMERFREYVWIKFWFRYKIKIYGTFQNHHSL